MISSTKFSNCSLPTSAGFGQRVLQIAHILALIDSDMDAALDELDKVKWGNRRGTYNDLKGEEIDPPIGFSRSQFLGRLKVFVKTYRS